MPSKIFVSVTEQTLKNIVRRQSIGPLHLAIHVVQNPRAGEQKSPWDKTNKGHYHLTFMNAVCLRCPCGLQHGGFVPREWLAAGPIVCDLFTV